MMTYSKTLRTVLLALVVVLAFFLPQMTTAVDYPECDANKFSNEVKPNILMASTNEQFIGYTEVRKLAEELLIKPILNPSDYVGLLGSKRGLLIYGPPGTGKTMVSQLNNLGYEVWKITYSDLWKQAFVGEGPQRLNCLFDRAEAQKNVVLLFDESELIFRSRETKTDEYSSQLLTIALNRLHKNAKFKAILITNFPGDVDFAIRRRFGNQVCIRLPDPAELKQMFCSKLESDNWFFDSSFVYDQSGLNNRLQLFSGDDIQRLAERIAFTKAMSATQSPIRTKTAPINLPDIEAALTQVRPTSTATELVQYALYSAKYSNLCFQEYLPKDSRKLAEAKAIFDAQENLLGISSGALKPSDLIELRKTVDNVFAAQKAEDAKALTHVTDCTRRFSTGVNKTGIAIGVGVGVIVLVLVAFVLGGAGLFLFVKKAKVPVSLATDASSNYVQMKDISTH